MEITAANLATWNATQLRMELPKGDDRTQLAAVAIEFESLFAKQMLDSMRATLNPREDLFYGGMAEEIFQDMLYEEYGRLLARTGSLGLADLIVKQYDQQMNSAPPSDSSGILL